METNALDNAIQEENLKKSETKSEKERRKKLSYAKELKRLRSLTNLSDVGFAEYIGVTCKAYVDWEEGNIGLNYAEFVINNIKKIMKEDGYDVKKTTASKGEKVFAPAPAMTPRQRKIIQNAKELKRLRDITGLLQKDFADYIGVNKKSYANWETGRANFCDLIITAIRYKMQEDGYDVRNPAPQKRALYNELSEWVKVSINGENKYACAKCKAPAHTIGASKTTFVLYPYCPHCGRKMKNPNGFGMNN